MVRIDSRGGLAWPFTFAAAIAGIVLGAAAIVTGLVAIGYYAWLDTQTPDH